MELPAGRPTVAEIDLEALSANFHALKAICGRAEIMAVVKADAYGHGAVEVARRLGRDGCGHFGVATLAEARELRANGVDERIYLMGGFFADQSRDIVALRVTPFLFDRSSIRALGVAANALNASNFPVHL